MVPFAKIIKLFFILIFPIILHYICKALCSTLDIFNKFFSNSHQNQTSISNTLKIKYGSWGNKDEFHRSCSTLKLSIRYKIMSCLWLVSINKTVAIVYVILPYFKSNTLSVKATFHLTLF